MPAELLDNFMSPCIKSVWRYRVHPPKTRKSRHSTSSRLHQLLPAMSVFSGESSGRKSGEKWWNAERRFEPSAKCLASVNRLCRRLLCIQCKHKLNNTGSPKLRKFSVFLWESLSICWYKRTFHTSDACANHRDFSASPERMFCLLSAN